MALRLKPVNKVAWASWNGAPITPPRPPRLYVDSATTDDYCNKDVVCEAKLNDSHVLLTKRRGSWEFWSRHGTLLVYSPSVQLYEALEALPVPDDTVFDGGLLHSKHSAVKDKLVLWDVLVAQGAWREGKTYEDNRALLESLTGLQTSKEGMKATWLRLLNFLRSNTERVLLAPWVSGVHLRAYFDLVVKNDPFATYKEPGVASACMFEGLVVKPLQGVLLVQGNNANYGGAVKFRRATGRHQF